MTVIICPACNTRFETAAVIPPSGRKVRCSKCGNVWQAIAVIEPAKPPVLQPAPPPMQPRPAPMAPRPAPMEPRPAAAPPRPVPPEPRPASPGFGTSMGRFPGLAPRPANGPAPNGGPGPAPKNIGPLSADDDFQPDVRGPGMNSPAEADDLGSYNAGALVNPDAGLATNIPIKGDGGKRKLPPAVAIGWGALALLLIMLAAMVAMAPKTVVSTLPGAAQLYALVGKPVNTRGLAIENVRSAWKDAGGQRVLEVEGNVVNLTSGNLNVPTVVITLLDANGTAITEFKNEGGPLAAGASVPFTAQIPSPPENVRSLKVSFAKAG